MFFSKKSDDSSTPHQGYGKFIAEFGMYQYDYPRISNLLEMADQLFIETQDRKLDAIEPFFNILKAIYYNFRPIIYAKRTMFEAQFKEIKELIKHWRNDPALRKKVPVSLIEKEEELYMELYEIKQIIGLGYKVERKESDRTKINRAFGLID